MSPRCRGRAIRLILAALIAVATVVPVTILGGSAPATAAGIRPVFTMYVPFEEQHIQNALFGAGSLCRPGAFGGHSSCTASATQNIRSTIGITAAADETIIYYDHWEDGYEDDIANPTQSTTEIWGDGDLTNGVFPGSTDDRINAGDVAVLENIVALARNPNDVVYDGRDKIAATRGIAVTRAAWGATTGTLHGGSVAASDLSKYGTRFSIPVGIDMTTASAEAFDYVGASIMASVDNTIVSIDVEGDGQFETIVALDEGESHFTGNGLHVGAQIRTTQPVQVHLLTGDINHAYESRWFEIFPDELLDDEYVAAVGTTDPTRPVVLLVHNPNTFPIDVDIDAAGTADDTTLTVWPWQTSEYDLPAGSGAHVSSADGRFTAISAIDPRDASSASYDWGYSLVPVQALTPGVVVGWAPGRPANTSTGGNHGSDTYSPVWVSPTANTDIRVWFDGDTTNPPDLVIPDVGAYESVQVCNTQCPSGGSGNHDMTGARISSSDDTLISVAWGQDPATNQPTNAYDLGITVLPSTILVVTKTAQLLDDADGDGRITPGDILEYTIELIDAGALALTNITADDPLPPELRYLPGTARYDGTPVPDDTTGTPFPFDDWGITVPDDMLHPGDIATFTYQVMVDPALTPVGDNIRNTVYAESDQANATATANINVYFPDLYTTKTASTAGPITPGDVYDYTVAVTNTGSAAQTGVTVTDELPDGLTLLSSTISYPANDPTASKDVIETWDDLAYDNDSTHWLTDWIEVDAIDGAQNPVAGNVRGINDGGSNRLLLTGSNQSIQRTIDATDAYTGTVSFEYRQQNMAGGDFVAFEVSTDGGTSWTTIDLFGAGNASTYTPVSHPLDAYVGNELTFRLTAHNMNTASDAFYFDDFRVLLPARTIVTETVDTAPTYGGAGIDLFEDEQFTVTLTVEVDEDLDPTTVSIRNEATAVSNETTEPEHASVTVDIAPIVLSGLLWEDVDGVGTTPAPGDPRLDGVALTLYDADGVESGNAITEPDGRYTFTGIAAGSYRIEVTDPDIVGGGSPWVPWWDADGVADTIIDIGPVDWGDVRDDLHFSFVRYGSISGTVFRDLDADGTLDPDEPGIGFVGVALFEDGSSTPVATIWTDPDGSYHFPDQPPGSYRVEVIGADVPGPNDPTTAVGHDIVLVSGGDVGDVDFGYDITTGVSITKQLNSSTGTVAQGGTATFSIEVRNTGAGVLSDVTVTDVLARDCDLADLTLAAGDTHVYSCSVTDVDADWDDWTNVVDVVATDQWGATVADAATADVGVIRPGVAVTITPTQQVVVSGTATFTIRVTNTGDVTLTDVYVSTSQLGDDCDVGGLTVPVGDHHEYTCQLPAVAADLTNTATVGGLDPNGDPVTAGPATGAVTVLVPALTVSKSPDTQQVVAGGTATFTIRITNTGETPVSDIEVVDALAPDCNRVAGALTTLEANGEFHEWTCTLTGVAAGFTNTVTASGTDPIANPVGPVSDTADVDLMGPAVAISITPATQTVPLDGTATFEITVTNTGDVDLSNVAVVTGIADCDLVVGELPVTPGQHVYTCQLTDVTDPTVDIEATVTADDPNGDPVEPGTDTAVVHTDPVAWTVTKTATPTGVIGWGTDATFTIRIDNLSSTPLTNVVVEDAATPDCDRTFALIASDDSVEWTCIATGVTEDFTNIVIATADDPLGHSHEQRGDAEIDVLTPGIEVTKVAHPSPTIAFGDDVEWTITVTNTGEADLEDVVVTDLPEPTCDRTIGVLPAGATDASTVEWTCTTTNVTSDLTNAVTVAASDHVGNAVGDIAEASVSVGEPAHLTGRVWDDIDGDGIQSPGEPDVANVTVTLHDGDGDQIASTATGAGGRWAFGPVPAGSYSIHVHPPAGTTVTARNVGSDSGVDSDVDATGRSDRVAVAAATTIHIDAGIYRPATIGDQIWYDLDGDGSFDGDEPPAAGITVTARWHGPDGVDDIIRTTVTDDRGRWLDDDAAPGTWTITATSPAGWSSMPVTVVVGSGGDNLDGDVGLVPTGSLGSLVYIDRNRNGQHDQGEQGAVGVVVTALWAGPDGVFGTDDDRTWTATSGSGGTWQIDQVPPGPWRVQVTDGDTPAGYTTGRPTEIELGPGRHIDDIALALAPVDSSPAPTTPTPTTPPQAGGPATAPTTPDDRVTGVIPATGAATDRAATLAAALLGVGVLLLLGTGPRRRRHGGNA